jgi:hypothetical protein
MPRSLKDFEQLLLLKLEVKSGALGNLEALWQSKPYRLFGEPVDENPPKRRSRYEIALIRKFVEAKRSAARQVKVMQHLGDAHRSPLARISWSDPKNPVPELVMFGFCEEGHSVYLLHAEGTWKVPQHRKTRHPEVARE